MFSRVGLHKAAVARLGNMGQTAVRQPRLVQRFSSGTGVPQQKVSWTQIALGTVGIFAGIKGLEMYNRDELSKEKWEEKAKKNQSYKKALGKYATSYPPDGLEEHVTHEPEWIQLGCGNDEYMCEEKGATFSGVNMPDELPDLTDHNSLLAQCFKEHPEYYKMLKDKVTSKGVTLGQCIKTGIDQKGHPFITICGLVAGDEESWSLFAPVFDYVLEKRHGHKAGAVHTTDMNVDNVSGTKIDPEDKYVLTSRCRTARSVKNFRLPPTVSFEERRKLEALIVEGLLSLEGDLKGDYYPLPGSRSYAPKPGGMSAAYAENLRSRGNLFQCPDSPLLLSSGCGRHWPDGRGIFHNDAMNFFVWIGEEDHMRIISMEKGDNVKNIFSRFARSTEAIQDVLTKNGHDFMHNEHLGFIAACPSNVGTGLRGGSMMKIPLISSHPDFRTITKKMGLQVRGSRGVDSGAGGGGVYDISNAERIGKSETTLLNIYIEGVANLIRWEGMLERGEDISSETALAKPGFNIVKNQNKKKKMKAKEPKAEEAKPKQKKKKASSSSSSGASPKSFVKKNW